ncbi:MAG TPA: XRE family transcriptional regulator [Acetobacteraceae bacterium]|nr:XRE family transcriptional regulator [Acetobacteraceae bacterium]
MIPGGNEAIALGSRLRRARTLAGATLEAIASAAGMTTGHLSRVERGEKLPSIGAVLRLASALGVSLGDLMGAAPVAGEVAIVRARQRSRLRMADGADSLRYEVLLREAACAGQSVTTYILDPAKDVDAISPTSHGGFELVYVLEGELEVQLGATIELLSAGDIGLFPGYLEHMVRPVDTCPKAKALIVIIKP